MVTLGLDASTTCVGYAFTEDKKILDMGFIDIKKEKTLLNKKLKLLEYELNTLKSNLPIIEEIEEDLIDKKA